MPRAKRPFRTPYVWIMAPMGVAMYLLMMAFLPEETWIRLVVWTAIGRYHLSSSYGAMACQSPPRFHHRRTPAGLIRSDPRERRTPWPRSSKTRLPSNMKSTT